RSSADAARPGRRGDRVRRRQFITLLGGAAAAWPLAARAQQPVRVKRIGLMANLQLRPIESFRSRLRELGYIEGQNLIVEYRFAEGREERYSDFAAELVALPVDLIVTWGTPAAFAAKRATTTIPIVLGGIGDVINTGLVSNLARPDANITGFIALNVELEEKRLELLKEVIPSLSRVAVLGNSSNPLNRMTPISASAAKTALNRLVSGVALRRAASSPRHRITMGPRRALGSDMENGAAFIIVLLTRVSARTANRTWTGRGVLANGAGLFPPARHRPFELGGRPILRPHRFVRLALKLDEVGRRQGV